MASGITVVVRFKDLENDEEIRTQLEDRCQHLSRDFPETNHYELSLAPDRTDITAHGHVSGKGIDLAAHATTGDVRTAGELVLDKLQRELRREHDKRIFAHRRTARKHPAKRHA